MGLTSDASRHQKVIKLIFNLIIVILLILIRLTAVLRPENQFGAHSNYIYLKIVLHFLLGLVIGGLFYNIGNDGSKGLSNLFFCFTCIIFFLYIPMLPVLLHFPYEIQLMKREHFNRWYDLSAYFWAFTVVNIPLQIFFAIIYLSLVYLITGQPLELHRSTKFFGTCFICAFIGESIAHNIASVFNTVNSVFIGSVLSCPIMLIAVQNFDDPSPLPLYRTIFMYMSYIRYGLDAIIAAMFGYDRPRLPCPKEEIYCHFSSPKKIIRLIGAETPPNFWLNIFALFIILVISKGFTYYLLRQRVQPNKAFQMIHTIRKMIKSH